LEKIALHIAEKTDILRMPEWKSARTDSEIDGLLGEKIAHMQIDDLMPAPAEPVVDGRAVQLHSIHFIGTIFKNGDVYRPNIDVTSELDLMSVVEHLDGTYSYYALGNVKVTKQSAAAEARTQNDLAEQVLNAHIAKTPAKFDETTTATVTSVYGQFVGSNEPIELTNKLKKGEAVSKLTIGAKDATGQYDKSLALSGQQIATIGLIIREIEKKRL
jgi:hypothetical protein